MANERKFRKVTEFEEVGKGLYLTPETRKLTAKYDPKDFTVMRYMIIQGLGKAEYEDIAARLIEKGQQRGQWVGVSYPRIRSEVVYSGLKENPKAAKMLKEITKDYPDITTDDANTIFSLMQFITSGNAISMLDSPLNAMHDLGHIEMVEIADCGVILPKEKMVAEIAEAKGGIYYKNKAEARTVA
jgi:hypothetical protein